MGRGPDRAQLSLSYSRTGDVIPSEAGILDAALAVAGALGFRTLALTLGGRRITVALRDYHDYLAGEADRATFRDTWRIDVLGDPDGPGGGARV